MAISDLMTGMYATIAVMAALSHRDRTGEGQYIDMALLDVQVAMLANMNTNYLASGNPPHRWGNAHPNIVPYQTFPTADGHIIVAVGNDGQYRRFVEAGGRPDLFADERFATKGARLKNRAALDRRVADAFATKTMAEWDALLSAAGAIYGPVRTWNEVFSDPEVVDNMIHELDHPLAGKLRFVGNPIRMSDTPAEMRTASPVLGQHTEEILAATGWPTRKLQTAAE